MVSVLLEILKVSKCRLKFLMAGFRSDLDLLKLQKTKSLLSQSISVFEPEIIHFSGKCLA